jgi:hypothetical protein
MAEILVGKKDYQRTNETKKKGDDGWRQMLFIFYKRKKKVLLGYVCEYPQFIWKKAQVRLFLSTHNGALTCCVFRMFQFLFFFIFFVLKEMTVRNVL